MTGPVYLATNAGDVSRHYKVQPRPAGARVAQFDADAGVVRSGWQAADMLRNDAFWLGLHHETAGESPFPVFSTGVQES